MKCIIVIIFLFLGIQGLCGQTGDLLWEDNFNTGQLESQSWNYETGTGVNGDWGTGQLDRATSRTENVSFVNGVPGAEDGCLVITTRKEYYIDRNYTSGRINTAGKLSWGPGQRMMARIYPRDVRYPGQGFAFWMMPDEIPSGWTYLMWPQGGEIDIMEYVGSIPFHNLGTVHYAWYWQNNQWADWNHGHKGFYYNYETQQVPDPSEPGYGGYPAETGNINAGCNSFHTYGIDWYTDRIAFFVDDHVYHIHYLNDGGIFSKDGQDGDAIQTADNVRVGVSEYSNHFPEWHPFEHKMYMILSAGVGGSQNTYGGPVSSDAVFPCSVFVDWVKVYSLKAAGLPDNLSGKHFKVFPNPAQDILNIEREGTGDCICKIFDTTGRLMMAERLGPSGQVQISKLQAGSYLVCIQDGDLTRSAQLIIKR